jgi:hypothetical protein
MRGESTVGRLISAFWCLKAERRFWEMWLHEKTMAEKSRNTMKTFTIPSRVIVALNSGYWL